MRAAASDYGQLLAQTRPEVVHKDDLNRAYLKQLETFLGRDDLSAGEEKLVELLTVLIRQYERERYKIQAARPVDIIRYLMKHRGLKQKDLVPSVFESESVASAVLSGSRDLTLKHINRLADTFDLSPEAFVDRYTR